MMRVMLYEAAQIMLVRSTQWSWLKAWAMQIAERQRHEKGNRCAGASPGRHHGTASGSTAPSTR